MGKSCKSAYSDDSLNRDSNQSNHDAESESDSFLRQALDHLNAKNICGDIITDDFTTACKLIGVPHTVKAVKLSFAAIGKPNCASMPKIRHLTSEQMKTFHAHFWDEVSAVVRAQKDKLTKQLDDLRPSKKRRPPPKRKKAEGLV